MTHVVHIYYTLVTFDGLESCGLSGLNATIPNDKTGYCGRINLCSSEAFYDNFW